jgi:hypothetical protein
MPTSFHHHQSTGSADTASRSVVVDGRSFPASSRNLVAASLLARPDRAARLADPRPTWSRP